ncbi:MAG: anti-sigma factor antagonist [Mycobacterium sp.]|nr:MAG: anti-sigma factor antagonist [Mycobacterium sp.]
MPDRDTVALHGPRWRPGTGRDQCRGPRHPRAVGPLRSPQSHRRHGPAGRGRLRRGGGVSTAILRPQGVLGAVEAKSLRDSFTQVLQNGDSGLIVDLTDVQVLSTAGLAAVTNLLMRGRRSGIQVRVLPPEEGSEAGLVIEQADLRRFLMPGGLWNVQADEPRSRRPFCQAAPHAQSLRHRAPQLLRSIFLSRS